MKSAASPMKRLLVLRLMEEEREEAELRKHRLARHSCLDALQASEARMMLASRALHDALYEDDRAEALSAEMVLACLPLQRNQLERRLHQLEEIVESATMTWRASRTRRLQMETILASQEAGLRKEALLREQKSLDGRFLSSRVTASGSPAEEIDESFPRVYAARPASDGTVHAKREQE